MRNRMSRLAAVLFTTGAGLMLAASAPSQPDAGPGGMGQMLIRGLQGTPGCIGVETAQTQGGKSVIFAWFENAEAARTWYNTPTHKQMMFMTGRNPSDHAPLAHVEDEESPVLVIASITFTDKPEIDGIPMPISQIAIELYKPLPGGAYINDRFAPKAMEIAHMNDYTQPKEAEVEPSETK